MSTESIPKKKRSTTQGHWVVLAMFGLGIFATSFLWIFWKMHVGPFIPLQQLLEKEYPNSKPRVEGGQRKMRDSFPKILRVTMKVDFNPKTKNEKRDAFVRKVERFIVENFDNTVEEFDLVHFEDFELHLFLLQPEDRVKTWYLEISITELIEQVQAASS